MDAIVERSERRIAAHVLAASGGPSMSVPLAGEAYDRAGAVRPVSDEVLLCSRPALSYRGRMDLGGERQWVEKPIRLRRAASKTRRGQV
jgi:hypothetical protein